MTDTPGMQRLKKRYERLASRLAQTELLLQGSITERFITKHSQGSEPEKTLGPYYQWTFKRNNKTVTVNLSAAQVNAFQKAIENNRKLEEILTEMRELSHHILDMTTQGVQRRKQRE